MVAIFLRGEPPYKPHQEGKGRWVEVNCASGASICKAGYNTSWYADSLHCLGSSLYGRTRARAAHHALCDQGVVEADLTFGGNGAQMAVRAANVPDQPFEELAIPAHIWGDVSPEDHTQVFNWMPAGDRYFIDCILHDCPATPNLWDGTAAQEVIEAAITSHRTGQWVNVRPL